MTGNLGGGTNDTTLAPVAAIPTFATIRRHKYPCEYLGWSLEANCPLWTSERLSAAPVSLEILMDELNKVAAREVNVWAVIFPDNAK